MRITLLSALCAVGVSLAACGDDPAALSDSPLVGSWGVVSIDGEALPIREEVRAGDAVCVFTLTDMEFTFSASGRYSGHDAVTRACGNQPSSDISTTFRGEWRVRGQLLYMKPEEGVESGMPFVLAGNELTLTGELEEGTVVTVLRRR